MARIGHPIHATVVAHLGLIGSETVLDLGCGRGPTLAAVAARYPQAHLIGFDVSGEAVAAANEVLAHADLRVVDLSEMLPIDDESVDAVVCHNVLECLAEPRALIEAAAAAMRPGAVAVWSHTDFDTIVINARDSRLCRRVVHAFADLPQAWMSHSDGQMGRKLPGLIARSPLTLDRVDTLVTTSTELAGDALARIDEMATALHDGTAELSADEVRRWRADVEQTATAGDFLYAETAFIVVSSKPSG